MRMRATQIKSKRSSITVSEHVDNQPIIRIENVSKSFPGADALRGLSVDIPQGTFVGLLGPNGSGKSTLLKLIAGLLYPDEGRILIEGKTPGRATKARVAYLPEIDHLYPTMTVKQTLDFMRAFFADWSQERAERLVDFMDLPLTARVGQMSKGMRGRLRLVVTLARSAPIVLLDEPLSGIDPPSRNRIVKAILSEYISGEQTMILSTHEIHESEPLFEQLLFLDHGKLILQGDAESLRQQYRKSIRDLLEEVYA